jgi:hypothetical protein
MKPRDPWPKQKRQANFKVIEQDLYTYKLMKKQIQEIIEEIDDMAAPSTTGNYNFYTSTAKKSKSVEGSEECSPNYSPDYIHGRKQFHFSDPTAKKAEQIMDYKRNILSGLELREMIRHVEAIEYVLERLAGSAQPEAKIRLALIEEKYFKCELTDEGIVQKLNISLRTFYYWKKGIVTEIGARLGFIV